MFLVQDFGPEWICLFLSLLVAAMLVPIISSWHVLLALDSPMPIINSGHVLLVALLRYFIISWQALDSCHI